MTTEANSIRLYSLPHGDHTLPYIWSVIIPLMFLVYDFSNNDWLDLIEPLSVFKYTVQNNVETAIITRTELNEFLKETRRYNKPKGSFSINYTRFQFKSLKFTMIQLLNINFGKAEAAVLESFLKTEDRVLILGAIKSDLWSVFKLKNMIETWKQKYKLIEAISNVDYKDGTPMCLISSKLKNYSKICSISDMTTSNFPHISQDGIIVEIYPDSFEPPAYLRSHSTLGTDTTENSFEENSTLSSGNVDQIKEPTVANTESENVIQKQVTSEIDAENVEKAYNLLFPDSEKNADSLARSEISNFTTVENKLSRLGFNANDSFDSLYETEDDNLYVESFDESEGSLESLKGNDDDEEEEEDIINELF